MANAVYPKGREALLGGGVSWGSDTIKIVLVTSSYTYNTAHDNLDDVSGGNRVAVSGALASKTATTGIADAADVTFTALTGSTVAAIIVYKHTGTESTSTLLAYLDTKADTSALAYVPNGSDLTIVWGAGGIFTI